MNIRIRPPSFWLSVALTLLNTSFFAIANPTEPYSRPCPRASAYSSNSLNAQRASLPLRPGVPVAFETTLLKTFSNTRGTDGRIVGRVSAMYGSSLSVDSQSTILNAIPSHADLTAWANECASGRNSITESWGSIRPICETALASYPQLPCVSITPLGSPVVPDV